MGGRAVVGGAIELVVAGRRAVDADDAVNVM
jgi:hypothetical protein